MERFPVLLCLHLGLVLVLFSLGCPQAPCPDGYLRDNNGNCVEVGADDDDDMSDDDDNDDDQQTDDDDDNSYTCTVWGYVHDEEFDPGTPSSGIGDVEVCIQNNCDTTDQSSVYHLEGIDQGVHTITADPPPAPEYYDWDWEYYSDSLDVHCESSNRFLEYDIPIGRDYE